MTTSGVDKPWFLLINSGACDRERVESPPGSIDSLSPCCILMQAALPNALVQQPERVNVSARHRLLSPLSNLVVSHSTYTTALQRGDCPAQAPCFGLRSFHKLSMSLSRVTVLCVDRRLGNRELCVAGGCCMYVACTVIPPGCNMPVVC